MGSSNCLKLAAGLLVIGSIFQTQCFPLGRIINAGKLFDEDDVCRSETCEATANVLRLSMDESVEPCEDFFKFACGGWISRNPVPPTEAHWSKFDILNKKVDFQLKGALEEKVSQKDPFPVNEAKHAYRACMDEERVKRAGLWPLIVLLDEYGGWPMTQPTGVWKDKEFDWQGMVAESSRRVAESPLLSAYVYLDMKHTSRNVITLDQTSLGLQRSMLVHPSTYPKQIEAYRKWIASSALEVSRAIRHTQSSTSGKRKVVPKVRIAAEASKVVEFESELAKITSPGELRRNAYRLYNPMRLKTLQSWTHSATIRTSYARIRWLRLLNILLEGETSVGPNERIVVKEVDYIIRLMALIDRTPLRVIANYLHWRIVQALSRDTSKYMWDLTFHFNHVLTGVKEEQPRWQYCVRSVTDSLSFATGYIYVHRFFDLSSKEWAKEMVGNIRRAFRDEVEKTRWMDPETQKAALKKEDAMQEFIGYPDWFENKTALEVYYKGLSVGHSHFQNIIKINEFQVGQSLRKLRHPPDRSEWTTGPAEVNAFYSPQRNSITFPAGILQPPFYRKGSIQALNYGSIGAVVGHEISHGFDDVGRQSDLNGNIAEWWSKSTLKTYLNKAQCFVNQYSNYRVPELDSVLGTKVLANGMNTQGENIADNEGLRQAMLAYHHFVKKHGPEARLVGMEKYTPKQLFYLGFAMVWCESSTKESLLLQLAGSHSLNRLRVQGTLSNSEDFALTYHCKPDSKMSSSDKCTIW